MANELCATGFGNDIDGQYQLMYKDHWSNDNYWIYKDSYYWMISSSEFLYDDEHLQAIKTYETGSWVDGDYEGVNGKPSGNIALGAC